MEVLLLCIFLYLKWIRNNIFVFILFSYTIRIWFSDAFRRKEADFLKFAEKTFSVFDFNTICRNCFKRKKSVFFSQSIPVLGKAVFKVFKDLPPPPPPPPSHFMGFSTLNYVASWLQYVLEMIVKVKSVFITFSKPRITCLLKCPVMKSEINVVYHQIAKLLTE